MKILSTIKGSEGEILLQAASFEIAILIIFMITLWITLILACFYFKKKLLEE